MRSLTIIGLESDENIVICKDNDSDEKFQIKVTERVKTAVSETITQQSQNDLKFDHLISPKEIQQRIRSGHTIEEVAKYSQMPKDKVERFAYPVLLERSRVAEMASRAHIIRPEGPSIETLSTLVYQQMASRGIKAESIQWDAWKIDHVSWNVEVSWESGKSDIRAQWKYIPGSHGGSVIELNEMAKELTDPNYIPVMPGATSLRQIRNAKEIKQNDEFDEFDELDEELDSQEIPQIKIAAEDAPTTKIQAIKPKNKRQKPAVPSWEDVLLGVRGTK